MTDFTRQKKRMRRTVSRNSHGKESISNAYSSYISLGQSLGFYSTERLAPKLPYHLGEVVGRLHRFCIPTRSALHTDLPASGITFHVSVCFGQLALPSVVEEASHSILFVISQ